jgi:predicted homoserine dehydrogenase-like protein
LDDIARFTSHTAFERADITCELDALPAGLAPNAKINRSIKVGEIIT